MEKLPLTEVEIEAISKALIFVCLKFDMGMASLFLGSKNGPIELIQVTNDAVLEPVADLVKSKMYEVLKEGEKILHGNPEYN